MFKGPLVRQTLAQSAERKNHMGNQIYKEISKFAEMQRKSVCMDPDSVIGKERMYQTALLHEILDEIRGEKK